jgi:hypothetical protein
MKTFGDYFSEFTLLLEVIGILIYYVVKAIGYGIVILLFYICSICVMFFVFMSVILFIRSVFGLFFGT